jgi:hypothetical protein
VKLQIRTTCLIALAVLLLFSLATAQVPQVTPFTADMQFSSTRAGSHSPDMNGKMYVSRTNMRMDMSSQGHNTTIISDFAAQTTYTLMPQQKMYMEFKAGDMAARRGMGLSDIKPLADPSNPCSHQENVTCKDLGPEQVSGRPCEHWKMTHKDGKVTDVWVDQQLHFPIKTVSQDSTWQLSNIQVGEPSASLFEIPADFHKMDMSGMMQGGRPSQQ